ncbi:hypothetical protein M2158_005751 [Streptomyces sp. SAI-144]|nr:hypothetical protein [Streptomyces sp. SAI-144]
MPECCRGRELRRNVLPGVITRPPPSSITQVSVAVVVACTLLTCAT